MKIKKFLTHFLISYNLTGSVFILFTEFSFLKITLVLFSETITLLLFYYLISFRKEKPSSRKNKIVKKVSEKIEQEDNLFAFRTLFSERRDL